MVTYMDNGITHTKEFEGRFSDRGYYEIFLRNESKGFPPVFSFVYGRHNINRIRLALSLRKDLIVDNNWNESANILFLGAGDSGRRQSFFALIIN